jgi:hypothetical protein
MINSWLWLLLVLGVVAFPFVLWFGKRICAKYEGRLYILKDALSSKFKLTAAFFSVACMVGPVFDVSGISECCAHTRADCIDFSVPFRPSPPFIHRFAGRKRTVIFYRISPCSPSISLAPLASLAS